MYGNGQDKDMLDPTSSGVAQRAILQIFDSLQNVQSSDDSEVNLDQEEEKQIEEQKGELSDQSFDSETSCSEIT